MKAIDILLALFVLATTITPGLAQKGRGIEIYQVKQSTLPHSNEGSTGYFFTPDKSALAAAPLLTEADLDHFDFEQQQVVLNQQGKAKIGAMTIPLEGVPVAVVLNGKPLYGFWFWHMASSHGCDWVAAYPTHNFKIIHGIPNSAAKGQDPRFSHQLKAYLAAK